MESQLPLEEAIPFWKQKGSVLLGFVWMNPKTLEWTISFNPETTPELREKWVAKTGLVFRGGNVFDDLKQ